MGGGSKGGSSGDQTFHFSPYLEAAHQTLMNDGWAALTDAEAQPNPFTGYSFTSADDAFLGIGYMLTSFPSPYDMFGKFIAGLDVETLYSQIYEDTVNSEVTNNVILAEAAYLEDDVNNNTLPKVNAGMRDMGAVMSSSFITAKTLIESQKHKTINKFAADIKMEAMKLAQERWKAHLVWNKGVIEQYNQLIELYWKIKFQEVDKSTDLAGKSILWTFSILDHQRAIVGALNGAGGAKRVGDSNLNYLQQLGQVAGQGVGIAGSLMAIAALA